MVVDHMAHTNLPDYKDGTNSQRGLGQENIGYPTGNWRVTLEFYGLYIETYNAQSVGLGYEIAPANVPKVRSTCPIIPVDRRCRLYHTVISDNQEAECICQHRGLACK